MKIAIIGNGRMGRLIQQTARERGHEISCVIDVDNQEDFASEAFRGSDVAIEFSVPKAAVGNILNAFKAGVPVVSGTTGWTAALPEIRQICDRGEGTLLYGSNFSVGVNIFMALNRKLAAMMSRFPGYKPSLTETHHIHKLDHPSGTAITLAEGIMAEDPAVKGWMEPEADRQPAADELPVYHVREGEVPGIHTIKWDSPDDFIEITHSAKSRHGFALGAVMGAEWLVGKKGFHTVTEMFNF